MFDRNNFVSPSIHKNRLFNVICNKHDLIDSTKKLKSSCLGCNRCCVQCVIKEDGAHNNRWKGKDTSQGMQKRVHFRIFVLGLYFGGFCLGKIRRNWRMGKKNLFSSQSKSTLSIIDGNVVLTYLRTLVSTGKTLCFFWIHRVMCHPAVSKMTRDYTQIHPTGIYVSCRSMLQTCFGKNGLIKNNKEVKGINNSNVQFEKNKTHHCHFLLF